LEAEVRWHQPHGIRPIADISEVNEEIAIIMTHLKRRIGVLPLFSDKELRRLTMPTLLLNGQEDALRDSRKVAEQMRKLVPDLSTKIIPQAGHLLYNNHGHIMPFLAATERA
jgi:pimeloyl-ACP methyl ester carboxylesterase